MARPPCLLGGTLAEGIMAELIAVPLDGGAGAGDGGRQVGDGAAAGGRARRGSTVEFGLQFTAEVGAVITKTAGECNLKVTLPWERGDDAAG